MSSTSHNVQDWAQGPMTLLRYPVNDTKEPCDFVKAAAQMVSIHNMLLRILNAIYIQAPHVQPKDVPVFVSYIKSWCETLHHHHGLEEKEFFPEIERQAGVEGLMDVNVEQHRLFDEGLEKMDEYLNGPNVLQTFNGKKLRELIDNFAPVLNTHLHDEIPTLLGLKKYEGKLDILGILDEIDKEQLKTIKFHNFAFAITGHDATWDGGRSLVEGMSWFMRVVMGFFAGFHSLAKFAPCDGWGNPRSLYAMKK